MHTYSVALRIVGSGLDVAQVSAKLRLQPTQTKVVKQPPDMQLWAYEVCPGNGNTLWDSLEDGLRTLLSVFAGREGELQKYQSGYKVFLWCGHFSSSFDGGPTLSPQMLKALGDFGVELILDTYATSDNDETGTE
jgi:hypothetical protein